MIKIKFGIVQFIHKFKCRLILGQFVVSGKIHPGFNCKFNIAHKIIMHIPLKQTLLIAAVIH